MTVAATSRTKKLGRLVLVAFLPALALSGCLFKYSENNTFGVAFGALGPRAVVSIYRTPTLRLRQLYRNVLTAPNGVHIPCSQRTWLTKTKCVRDAMRGVGPHSSYQFVQDRWNAALADDQLSDIHTLVEDSAAGGRCLTVDMKVNLLFGDIGYNWTLRDSGADACRSGGSDPVPGFGPPLGQ